MDHTQKLSLSLQMEKLQLIKNNFGQSLLEAVIALAALMLILSASAVAIVTSVNNATFLRNQNQASKLAQEGMEFVRNEKNTSFNNFRVNIANGTKCLNGLKDFSPAGQDCTQPSWPITTSANYQFIRDVAFNSSDADCSINTTPTEYGVRVRVNVRWTSGKCPAANLYCHTSYVESCMFPPL